MKLHWIGLDKTRDSNLSPASLDGTKWAGIGGDRASWSNGSFVSTLTLADNVIIELSKVAIPWRGWLRPASPNLQCRHRLAPQQLPFTMRTLKASDWFHRDGFPLSIVWRDPLEKFTLHTHESSEIVIIFGGKALHVIGHES